MSQTFGERVRTLREARYLGLRKLAERVGMSPTYLSKIERGQFPPPSEAKIKLIAGVLEQDPDEFLALAGRVSSDLSEIIKKRPSAIATFLRAAEGLTAADIERLTKQAVRRKGEG